MSEELLTIKTKLRKIAALAQRGVGGEKANAKSLLQKLLAKHHLTLDDVLETAPEKQVQRYWFRCKSDMERQVLLACYARATNQPSITYWVGRGEIGVDLSRLDALEMQSLWQHFRPLLRKEMKKLREQMAQAFACKHHLYGATPAEPNPDRKPLSREEMEALRRLMGGLEDTNYVSTRRQMAG